MDTMVGMVPVPPASMILLPRVLMGAGE
jgi:hypothetical protein